MEGRKRDFPSGFDRYAVTWCNALFERLETRGVLCSVVDSDQPRPSGIGSKTASAIAMVSIDFGPPFYVRFDLETLDPRTEAMTISIKVLENLTWPPTVLANISLSPRQNPYLILNSLADKIVAFKPPPAPLHANVDMDSVREYVDDPNAQWCIDLFDGLKKQGIGIKWPDEGWPWPSVGEGQKAVCVFLFMKSRSYLLLTFNGAAGIRVCVGPLNRYHSDKWNGEQLVSVNVSKIVAILYKPDPFSTAGGATSSIKLDRTLQTWFGENSARWCLVLGNELVKKRIGCRWPDMWWVRPERSGWPLPLFLMVSVNGGAEFYLCLKMENVGSAGDVSVEVSLGTLDLTTTADYRGDKQLFNANVVSAIVNKVLEFQPGTSMAGPLVDTDQQTTAPLVLSVRETLERIDSIVEHLTPIDAGELRDLLAVLKTYLKE